MTDTEQKAMEMLRKDLERAYNKKTLFVETTYNALDISLNLIQKQDTEINKLKKEKEYYKKLYNESYNFLDPKFTGNHIPRID